MANIREYGNDLLVFSNDISNEMYRIYDSFSKKTLKGKKGLRLLGKKQEDIYMEQELGRLQMVNPDVLIAARELETFKSNVMAVYRDKLNEYFKQIEQKKIL